jgi:hypothetical protein
VSAGPRRRRKLILPVAEDQIASRNTNGAALTIVERLTPINPATVEWSTTIDDRAAWTRP